MSISSLYDNYIGLVLNKAFSKVCGPLLIFMIKVYRGIPFDHLLGKLFKYSLKYLKFLHFNNDFSFRKILSHNSDPWEHFSSSQYFYC